MLLWVGSGCGSVVGSGEAQVGGEHLRLAVESQPLPEWILGLLYWMAKEMSKAICWCINSVSVLRELPCE